MPMKCIPKSVQLAFYSASFSRLRWYLRQFGSPLIVESALANKPHFFVTEEKIAGEWKRHTKKGHLCLYLCLYLCFFLSIYPSMCIEAESSLGLRRDHCHLAGCPKLGHRCAPGEAVRDRNAAWRDWLRHSLRALVFFRKRWVGWFFLGGLGGLHQQQKLVWTHQTPGWSVEKWRDQRMINGSTETVADLKLLPWAVSQGAP